MLPFVTTPKNRAQKWWPTNICLLPSRAFPSLYLPLSGDPRMQQREMRLCPLFLVKESFQSTPTSAGQMLRWKSELRGYRFAGPARVVGDFAAQILQDGPFHSLWSINQLSIGINRFGSIRADNIGMIFKGRVHGWWSDVPIYYNDRKIMHTYIMKLVSASWSLSCFSKVLIGSGWNRLEPPFTCTFLPLPFQLAFVPYLLASSINIYYTYIVYWYIL